jgi:predicted metal-dependent hydrolase
MLNWLKSAPDALPEHLQLAGQQVPLAVSRHHNARRMTLRYDAQRRQVRLTLPPRAPLHLALGFLQEKEAWLAAQIKRHPQVVPFVAGAELPVLGQTLVLAHSEGLRGRAEKRGNVLHITCPAESLPRRVEDWLKGEMRVEMLREVTAMADTLGVKFGRVSLRDTSSRWGSCSAEGNLSFCWRLVFAPRHILSYLIAHEVAHLKEMNHSPAFWAEVAKLHPEYKCHRQWLTDNASELHRYGA